MVLVGVIAGVVAIGATYAKGAVRGETGYIFDGADVCQTNALGKVTADMLEEYSALLYKLHAAGGYDLDNEDMARGKELEKVCGEIEGNQMVRVLLVDGDYILVEFAETVAAGYFYPYITHVINFTAGQPL
jgi:hypothetical protein